jgi:predicted GNAT superfamily acetyltransferase
MRVDIRFLEQIEEFEQIEDLQEIVWQGSKRDVVPAHMLLAVAHNGGLVLGAFVNSKLVGFVMGFIGVDQEHPERVAMTRLKHASHMLAVHPDFRDQGIGYQLKLAQRDIVNRQGIRLVTWTYDPLMSSNAHLNIRKLGAVCNKYIENAYGEMRDQLNYGIDSDRFQLDWWITSNRVRTRVDEMRPPLDLAHYLSAGIQKINPGELDIDRGILTPSEQVEYSDSTLILVEIPPNFEKIKDIAPEIASNWRTQTREIFNWAFSAGYLATDFVYLSGDSYPRAYYVLSSGEGTFG